MSTARDVVGELLVTRAQSVCMLPTYCSLPAWLTFVPERASGIFLCSVSRSDPRSILLHGHCCEILKSKKSSLSRQCFFYMIRNVNQTFNISLLLERTRQRQVMSTLRTLKKVCLISFSVTNRISDKKKRSGSQDT